MNSQVSGLDRASLPDALQRARDYGIDLSLLDDNLRLSPKQRMERHDEAVSEILYLQQHTSNHYGSL
jgi:hypothetical protein